MFVIYKVNKIGSILRLKNTLMKENCVETPFKYLELSIEENMRCLSFWKLLNDKICAKLSRGKCCILSTSGL